MRALRRFYWRLREYYGIWVHGVYTSTGEPIPRCYRCGKRIKSILPSEADGKDFHRKCYTVYMAQRGTRWPKQ